MASYLGPCSLFPTWLSAAGSRCNDLMSVSLLSVPYLAVSCCVLLQGPQVWVPALCSLPGCQLLSPAAAASYLDPCSLFPPWLSAAVSCCSGLISWFLLSVPYLAVSCWVLLQWSHILVPALCSVPYLAVSCCVLLQLPHIWVPALCSLPGCQLLCPAAGVSYLDPCSLFPTWLSAAVSCCSCLMSGSLLSVPYLAVSCCVLLQLPHIWVPALCSLPGCQLLCPAAVASYLDPCSLFSTSLKQNNKLNGNE
jgi:hypothetical protein